MLGEWVSLSEPQCPLNNNKGGPGSLPRRVVEGLEMMVI